jgi:hypothetical protein
MANHFKRSLVVGVDLIAKEMGIPISTPHFRKKFESSRLSAPSDPIVRKIVNMSDYVKFDMARQFVKSAEAVLGQIPGKVQVASFDCAVIGFADVLDAVKHAWSTSTVIPGAKDEPVLVRLERESSMDAKIWHEMIDGKSFPAPIAHEIKQNFDRFVTHYFPSQAANWISSVSVHQYFPDDGCEVPSISEVGRKVSAVLTR